MSIIPAASAPSQAGQAPISAASDGEATISSDFQTFLRMLTTQLQNQDPLDPVDTAEFSMQLATFAGVEQQVLTNTRLEALNATLAATGLAEMSSWVGREVRAAAPGWFDGAPVTVAPNPAAIADKVDLVVTDAQGTEVDRYEIPVSADPIEWAGVDSNGTPLPDGAYTFEVISYSQGEEILREYAEVYSEVREVRSEGGQMILILEDGTGIAAANATGLRNPPPAGS